MLYCIGASIRKYPQVVTKFKSSVLVLVVILCTIVIMGWSFMEATALNYNDPLVMVNAVAIFMLFLGRDMGSIRWINALASGSFAVYVVNPYLYRYFDIPRFVAGNTGIYLLHTLGVAVAIYLVGWILGNLYDLLFGKIRPKLPEYEI
jgi:hypothetical protein